MLSILRLWLYLCKGMNTFRLTEVKTGISESGYKQLDIEPAELENEKIVLKNAYSVRMKMKNTAEE